MNNKFFALLMSLFFVFSLYSQDVDREELERNMREVEFINYMGPHDVIESRGDIMSIGASLARSVLAGSEQAAVSGKYRILHLTDSSEPGKLGADILVIEKDARVDHIRNLRLILAAYLQAVYSYSQEDSMLIAEFATYYNAVFRGNIPFFEERYINRVLVNLSSENAGIDVHYENWPGKTRLVVPLRSLSGSEGKPDPFELADREVIEDLRKEEGMGIEQRKKIVELQEDEVEQERAELEERKEVIAESEKTLEEKEKGAEERAAGAFTRQEKEEVEKEKAALEEERKALEGEKREAEAGEARIAEKEQTIADERESIARDAEKVLEEKKGEEEKASVAGAMEESARIPFLKLQESSGRRSGRFVFYDSEKMIAVVPDNAPETSGRIYLEISGGYLLPVKDDSGRFVIAMLSENSLLPEAAGTEEVWHSSFLLADSENYYCIARNSSGRWSVALYDRSLKVKSFSEKEADPDTFIIKKGGKVLFQALSGEIVSVDAQTLR